MSRKTPRTYVSSHVYRTPTGMFYDDRVGKRLTARRGRASEAARVRMEARFRDDQGKLTFKILRVRTDMRNKETGEIRYNQEADVPVSYDPDKAPDLASDNARKHLNEDSKDWIHFNTSLLLEEAIS